MKLLSSVYDVESLSADDRGCMFELMQRSYENKRRELFDADLNAKQWVILVRRPADDRIVGFSTQVLLTCRVDKELVTALYSGDTVVDRSEWGDPALAHAWGNFAVGLIDGHLWEPGTLYWLLTSKGFRTYHYLPLFFRQYFPYESHAAMPSRERAIIDAFGMSIGGNRYDSQSGIIHANGNSDFVRREIAESGARRANSTHVRAFAELNPGYMRGDELCCLAPLSRENFTRAAYRVIGLKQTPEHSQ
jgi:hypothetical protein